MPRRGQFPAALLTIGQRAAILVGESSQPDERKEVYDLSGKRLYDLRGRKIYKPTGELMGHLSSVTGDRRLDKSTDRLFPKV